jgi:predicted dehydrogenase
MPNNGNPTRPLRLGLVGCGRLAELGYVPALASLDEVELAAAADPDARRRALIATNGTRAFASADALLEDGAVDALIVASPAREHARHAELAAEAGLACLVEKPPAVDAVEAERLAEMSPAIWIGFNRRFQHGARLLAGVPSEGPLELELELRYRRPSWCPLEVADAALIDLVPHLVDLTLLITGAEDAAVQSATVGEERVSLELATARGRASLACATDRAYLERAILRDADGRRVAESVAGGPLRALATRLPGREHPLVESLREQLRAFAAAVRGGDPGLLASARDGARAMRVVDAVARGAP